MTPQELEALLQQYGSGQSQDEYDEAAEPAGARKQRASLLLPVLRACEQAWASRSDEVEALAQKLGNGSRDVAWRLPLGDAGILDFFLAVLAHDGLAQGLQVHALRLVGNACADTDENRARVVQDQRLASVMRHLHDARLTPFTIPVLYNILVDYEPAQLLASQTCLSRSLVARLSSPSMSKHVAFVPYLCKILALLVAQEGEASVADPSTAHVLLSLAMSSPAAKEHLDHFASLVGVAAAYLAKEGFQSRLIAQDHVVLFIDALYHANTNLDVSHAEHPDAATQLKQLRSSLLTTLADLSATDAFSSHYPLSSPVSQSFLTWIRGANPPLQAAACLALGNLSRSDGASIGLVERDAVHVPLIKILSNPAVRDPQLLHSALSFLKNLAIPAQNKAKLGDLLDPTRIPRMYSLDTLPQVQFAAISLTRLLLANCPPNVRRACTPLSADPLNPDHERSIITSIVALFDRSDAEPTKLEASRSIAALCRVLHSTALADVLPGWGEAKILSDSNPHEPSPSVDNQKAHRGHTDDESRRSLLYQRHNVSRALAFLLTQQKWPILRSEAWFVFALMSRSKDGAALIADVLQTHAALNALVEAVTGRKKSDETGKGPDTPRADGGVASMATTDLQLEPQQVDPAQRASMAQVDRENALVLCTELLRSGESELPPPTLTLLQNLVHEGTEMIAAERSQQ